MEEDQKLFDMCTQNFNKQREDDQERMASSQKKWESLEKAAHYGNGNEKAEKLTDVQE